MGTIYNCQEICINARAVYALCTGMEENVYMPVHRISSKYMSVMADWLRE